MTTFMKVLLALVATVALVIFLLGRDHATRYCPIGHWISVTGICLVLDRAGGRVLIQHGELDFNVYYFEIRDDGESTYYQFPFDLVAQIGPGDYTARFDPNNEARLIVEGQLFELIRIETPWW